MFCEESAKLVLHYDWSADLYTIQVYCGQHVLNIEGIPPSVAKKLANQLAFFGVFADNPSGQ